MWLRSGRRYSFKEDEKKILLEKKTHFNSLRSLLYIIMLSLFITINFDNPSYNYSLVNYTNKICNISTLNFTNILNFINNTDEIDPYFDYF